MARKTIFILASHEPTLDPRIDWIAGSAASLYDTRVVGFHLATRPAPEQDTVRGYRITRLAHARFAALILAGRLVSAYFTPRSQGWRHVAGIAVKGTVALLLLPPIALLLCLGALAAGLTQVHPVQWVGACFHGFRRAYARRVTPAEYERMRDAAHAFNTSLRTYVAAPMTRALQRWLPWTITLRDAVRHRLRRLGQFIYIWKHIVRINGSLLRVGRETPRPDLIYCNDLETLLAGVLLKNQFGCRLIYDAHEYMACAFPDYLWLEARCWASLERLLLAHVDAAFTVNPLLAAAMTEAYGFPFQSLPNCEPVGSTTANTSGVARDALADLAPGRTRFLYQGNIDEHRGVEEIVLAWARVDSTRAVLFVRGPESVVRNRCMQLAADLGLLNKSIFFPDAVREHDLVSAAAQADVGIISYKPICINNRLACPNKTSQYMQAGLAILTNNLEYVKQLVADFECGLAYDSGAMDSFVVAVNRLAGDADLLRTCKENARRKFIEVFNWETQSRDLFETCERLLNGTGAVGEESATRRAA